MNWIHCQQILLKLQEALEHTEFPQYHAQNVVEYMEKLTALEMASRTDLDASVRYFSRQRKWPDFSNKNEFFFLRQRAVVAMIVVRYLSLDGKTDSNQPLPVPPESFSDEDQIELLLIHGWYCVGCKFWLEQQRIGTMYRFPRAQ
jgi:hypothetical protein